MIYLLGIAFGVTVEVVDDGCLLTALDVFSFIDYWLLSFLSIFNFN
jgi:hypothetical protein